jgi:glycosyltransferase involved in cell wall biosynthesis
VKISAVVISENEEHNIDRCLKSLLFCDEIILVDSNSTDQTRELAKKYTKHIVLRAWSGYSDQKNFANGLAENDWVLSVDADEEVSPELKREINLILSGENSYSAFHAPRKTYHSGKWIRYGGWYPNRLVRLFRKSEGTWVGDELHERWNTQGRVGKLENHIHHFSFRNIFDQVERNNRYSSLGAVSLAKRGKKFSLWKICTKPPLKFFETYLLKFGFRDGFPGFLISVSAAYSVFLKWAKLWEFTKSE